MKIQNQNLLGQANLKAKNRIYSTGFISVIFFLFLSFQASGQNVLQEGPVLPEPDGSLILSAEKGKAIGPEIKYMPEWKAYGWFTAADKVEWTVEVAQEDKYDVFMEWSVSDEQAGKPFIFEAGDQKLVKKVGKTGSWETYKNKKIGRIHLAPGKQIMEFKSGSDFEEGGLIDLRSLKLVPVK